MHVVEADEPGPGEPIAAPVRSRASTTSRRLTSLWVAAAAAIVMGTLFNDWASGCAMLVLWAGWYFLPSGEGGTVLGLAFTLQWLQVTAAPLYYDFTGRKIKEMAICDYEPMVWVGLGCLVALLAGLCVGRLLRPPGAVNEKSRRTTISWQALIWAYALLLVGGGIAEFIGELLPQFRQFILTAFAVRYGILFLIFRRLVKPPARWRWFVAVIALECGVGLTGYFSEFKEPLMLAGLALFEVFDRKVTAHYVTFAGLSVVLVTLIVMWSGIKVQYRKEFRNDEFAESRSARVDYMQNAAVNWVSKSGQTAERDVDHVVQRLWMIPYQAMALKRVPDVVPHTNGALLFDAFLYAIMPRLIFPNKPSLEDNDGTDKIRRFAGVKVAGVKKNTSITFGKEAESYVDFGIPLMFVPLFLYALSMGFAHRFLTVTIESEEVAMLIVISIFWFTLCNYGVSWYKTLGGSLTKVVVIGAMGIFIDRSVLGKGQQQFKAGGQVKTPQA